MAVFRSKVSKAVAHSPSVRTTIPEAVAAILGAEAGSTLVWEIEPGTGLVTVRVGIPSTKGKRRKGAPTPNG